MRTHPVAGFLLVCLAVSPSWAQPLGTAFTYQGRLKNGGSPANGSFNMDFKLYPVPVGGTLLASQALPGVTVSDGLFTVQVDLGAGAYDGNQRWLEVAVNGTPLLPRQPLTAAPYSHFALNAGQLDGLDSTAFLTSVPNPLTLTGTNPSYIIGGQNSSAVNGAAGLSGTATAASGQVYGVQGVTLSTNGFGVFGSALSLTGPAHGGYFETSSTDGIGVVGQAKATTGAAYGVYGQSVSSSGRGVFGLANAGSGATFGGQFESVSPSGTGVFGHATAGSGITSGVYGQTASVSGFGVQGYAYNGSGANFGGYFHTDSTSGSGVYGSADAASGTNYGGRFASQSPTGNGVFGIATASSGVNRGVYGQSASSSGRAVQGWATSTSGANFGGYFQSDSPGGRGVYGFASAGSGATYGGQFEASSQDTDAAGAFGLASALSGNTYGVWGKSNSTSGIGVYGTNDRSSGTTYGVYGRSSSTDGRGVYGLADATSGVTYGGSFESKSLDNYTAGVYGLASGFSSENYGVLGQSNSIFGIGVMGVTPTTAQFPTYGVYGQSSSRTGRGVYGIADTFLGAGLSYGGYFETKSAGTNATGVFGLAGANGGITVGVWGQNESSSGFGVVGTNDRPSGTTYGVYGRAASPSGWAVFAQGNFGASGSKSFRIDHPDDPANKYLLHYSAESPEVINFYSGKVILDASGKAVVELPHYFARINKDPRYTLTAIGAPMPMLHVSVEIDEAALDAGAKAEPGQAVPTCSFRIAGGAPGAKVSWRVEALRNDRWVQKNGAPVEVEKQGGEKGTYQHPGLYGQPPEKGMNYEAQRAARDAAPIASKSE